MTATAVRVEAIAPIDHKEGMALAETEYRRYTDMLDQLRPEDWTHQTVNTDWNSSNSPNMRSASPRAMASFRLFVKDMRAGKKRAELRVTTTSSTG